MHRHLSRRQFLRRSAAAAAVCAAPAVLPAAVLGAGPRPAPSERIALGFVGTGSQGIGMNLRNFRGQPDAQAAALCDVDKRHLARAVRTAGGADKGIFTTGDWRELVARRDLDAVVVSTPDHWHVPIAVAAARAGKDVFCEKPLSLTVSEGRILSDTVSRFGRVFQTGSENRSKGNFVRACELVRNGRIGRLREIHTTLNRGPVPRSDGRPQPVPEWLDYDMWLGPAPDAPYCRGRCHFVFRYIRDYSGGQLTDLGAHILDIAQWGHGTDRTGPVRVEGRGVFPDHPLYNTAVEWDLTYTFADGVTLTCRHGRPRAWGNVRFVGTDGWVHAEWNSVTASTREILESPIGAGDIRLRTCPGREQRDFLDCVKSRAETYAPAEVGHRTASLAHLGNIAMLLGRPLRWDPDRERFANDDTANGMLSRAMRSPWTL
jgi:predicted dehydrogenase